jgi:hypothetical protein
MRHWATTVLAVLAAAVLVGDTAVERSVAAQSSRGSSLTAVPGAVGFLDPTGPYEVVPGWPKDLSTLPGNEGWTFGAGQGVFAESPDRVYYIQRGQLPVLPQAGGRRGNPLPQIGPNLIFPVAGMWRNATQASPPGALEVNGKVGDDSDAGKAGVDFLWENCIVVINRNGDIIETWKQWDKMLRRPHSVYISPYDPQKNVYIVDDYRHAIFKFTNDGKTLLKTIGEPNVHASDDKHFYRPTFMAFQADGSYYVADGYANTRVVKFDKNDNYVTAWGERGEAGKETRPNYFNNVHGVGVDPGTRQVYVNDRGNRRIQVFDENGKFIRMWSMQPGTVRPRPAFRVHRRRPARVGLRPGHPAARATRSRRTSHLRVGRAGLMAGRTLRRARHQRGPGTEPVSRGGRARRRAEVPSEARRESGVPGWQERLLRVEVAW